METPLEHLPLMPRAERYWVESRRPLAGLALVAPLLVIYESGVLWFGVRPNGADDFMRRVLDLFGFGQHFLLPLLMIGILLGWHYLSHSPWRLSGGVLSAMAVESIALGLCVWVIARVQNTILAWGMFVALKEGAQRAIGFLGAGIYEELLFRLILLTAFAWAIRQVGAAPRLGMFIAVVVSSLLFSAAHHIGANGEPFFWSPFIFRFLAGVFFSVVFIYRGFGIAAASHAAYDIIVGVF